MRLRNLARSLLLTTAVVVASADAKTVIELPPESPPRLTTRVLDDLRHTYRETCLAALTGDLHLSDSDVAKVCTTVGLLVDVLQAALVRLCPTNAPQPIADLDGCPPPDGVTAPWPGRVE